MYKDDKRFAYVIRYIIADKKKMCPFSNGMSKVLACKGIVVFDQNGQKLDRFFKFQCSSFLSILT